MLFRTPLYVSIDSLLIFDEGTDLSDNTRAHFEPDHAIDAQRAGGD